MNDIKASPAYVGRFQRVCRYIARHLDEPLSLETLSAIAHSSPYHFHRQFSAYTGIPLYRYIQWLRLRRACWHLAFNPAIKSLILPLMPDFRMRSRSVVPSVPRLTKARPNSVNNRTGPSGIDAYRNIRYRSKRRWTSTLFRAPPPG